MTSKISYFLLFMIGSLGNMPFCSAMDTEPLSPDLEPPVSFKIVFQGDYWSKKGKKIPNRILRTLNKKGLIRADLSTQVTYLEIAINKLVDNKSDNTDDSPSNKSDNTDDSSSTESDKISSLKLYKELDLILSKAHSSLFFLLCKVDFTISYDVNVGNSSDEIIPKKSINPINLNNQNFKLTISKIAFSRNAIIGTFAILTLVSLIGYYLYKSVRQALFVKKPNKKESPKKSTVRRDRNEIGKEESRARERAIEGEGK